MKLSEWIEKYGDCEITEDMEKMIKPKKEKWKPKDGDDFWYIDLSGFITHAYFMGISHQYIIDYSRFFKTPEEADRCLEIMEACKVASFEPDWEDSGQGKYYFTYVYKTHEVNICVSMHTNFGGQFYFKSKDVAQELIDKFGEKDIAKYVLNVEID